MIGKWSVQSDINLPGHNIWIRKGDTIEVRRWQNGWCMLKLPDGWNRILSIEVFDRFDVKLEES